MVWVMGNVGLLLEWLTVPLFIIALQLPQGAVLYWLVSSLTALAQVPSCPAHFSKPSRYLRSAPISCYRTARSAELLVYQNSLS